MNDLKTYDIPGTLKRMGGRSELVDQLAEFLFQGAPPLLKQLEEAVQKGDAHAVKHAAHSLKGLVVNFGADAARVALEQLELSGRNRTLETTPLEFQVAEQRVSELLTGLREALPRFALGKQIL